MLTLAPALMVILNWCVCNFASWFLVTNIHTAVGVCWYWHWSLTRTTLQTLYRHPCMSDDFPVQLATRLPDWSAGGLLRCSAARLFVCRCRSPKSPSTTHTTCCRHSHGDPREDPRSILIQHVRHARFPRGLLATSLRGCHGWWCYEENYCRGI